MKFLKAFAMIVGAMILLFLCIFVAGIVFIFPYMLITGEEPHVLLVNLWYMLLVSVVFAFLLRDEL